MPTCFPHQSTSFFFSFIMSCLVFFSFVSSSLSVSCLLSLCDVVCVSVCCVLLCVSLCVVWHDENVPCVDSRTPPCVHSKRPMYAGNTRTCVSTCARGAGTHREFECTHGKRFESTHGGSSTVLLTKICPHGHLTPEVHQE